jgi:hypothetical protein
LFLCSDLYIKYLEVQDIPKVTQRKQTSKETKLSYFKVHLFLSARYKKTNLLLHFLKLLQSQRKQLRFSLDDMYTLLHSKDELGMSCLNIANQNKDKVTAKAILEFEGCLHLQDKTTLMRCVRENVQGDELKVPLAEQCRQPKPKLGKEKKGKTRSLIMLVIETLFLSILPYAWDEVSDIRLYLTYSKLSYNSSQFYNGSSVMNSSLNDVTFGSNGEYQLASGITRYILIVNGIVYLFGFLFSSPTWIIKIIGRINVKINRKADLIRNNYYDNQEEFIKLKTEYLKTKKVFLYLFRFIARLLWPLLILLPHQYFNMTSNLPSTMSKDRYKSENLWLFVKVVEASLENVLQMALQVWLLLPMFSVISQWSWGQLTYAGMKGALSIITFGLYEPTAMEISLGKIGFTVLMLSLGHAMMRLQKPGLAMGRKLKVLPVLFLSVVLQVVSRLYVCRNMMLMMVSGWTKYSSFLLIHFMSVLIIKLFFETRVKQMTVKVVSEYTKSSFKKKHPSIRKLLRFQRLQKSLDFLAEKLPTFLNGIRKAYSMVYNIYNKAKRPVLLMISCLSSSVLMVDLHWNSSKLHYPKHNFISHFLFHLLIFLENLMLTILPILAPSLFPSSEKFNQDSFYQAIWIVNSSWVIVVGLEVSSLYSFCFLPFKH